MQPNIPSELNLCLRCPGYGCVASIGIKTFCPTGFQTWSSSCCDRFMAGLTGLNYKIAGYRTLTFKMAASIWLKITRDRQGVAEWFILPGQIGLPRYASSITTLCDSNSAKVWVQRLLWQFCVFHRRIFDDWFYIATLLQSLTCVSSVLCRKPSRHYQDLRAVASQPKGPSIVSTSDSSKYQFQQSSLARWRQETQSKWCKTTKHEI